MLKSQEDVVVGRGVVIVYSGQCSNCLNTTTVISASMGYAKKVNLCKDCMVEYINGIDEVETRKSPS